MTNPWTYRAAGLDLDTYDETLRRIAPLVRRTQDRTRVLDGFGGFASLFELDPARWLFTKKYRRPVLVTCTDGVGSKLKIATAMNKYDTVGIDLVAMSVNDCLCTGAEPLVFLDYLAMPKDDPGMTEQLIKGISDGCLEADCSLTGGEIAILPDCYQPGDFDMAGFCVGVVDRDHIINGQQIQVGDKVIGLASSGLHSNGYTLVRKVVFDHAQQQITDVIPELEQPVGAALLTPTRIYVRPILSIIRHYPVKRRVIRGLAHITGGGLPDNLKRILPEGRRVRLDRNAWPVPPIFAWLERLGNISSEEMARVFNLGIGFAVVVSAYFTDSIVDQLVQAGIPAWVIGEVIAGEPGVEL